MPFTPATIPATGGTVVAGTVRGVAGDITTSSVSFVDLTGASITLITGARRVLLTFTSAWFNNTLGQGNYVTFLVDGSNVGGTNGLSMMAQAGSVSFEQGCNASFLTDVLTAASHTFKVQWRVGGNTGTMHASASNPYTFNAVEIAV